MKARALTYPARLVAITVAYVVTARLGQVVAIEPGNVSAVWIPSGIAVGAMILWGGGVWPAVWIGAFAYNFWFFRDGGTMIEAPVAMFLAVGIATGSTLMARAGSALVGFVQGFGEDLGRPRDALAYLGLAGLLATTISATVGTAVLLLGEQIVPARVGLVWTTWWFGDATGVILVAPLVVLFGRLGFPRFPGRRAWAPVGGAAALLLLLYLSFGAHAPRGTTTIALALPVTLLSWTAFVLGRRITALTAFLVAAVAVWATAHGEGPLVGTHLNESLILLHAFLDTAAFTGLLLATTVRAARSPTVIVPGSAPPSPAGAPGPGTSEQHRQMEQAIAQRRREESALADRVRALADEARTLERQLERRATERDAILAVLPDLFYVIDRSTQRFVMASEAFAREAAGLGRDAMIGRTIYDVLAPELALYLGEQHREVFSTGDVLQVIETLPLATGPRRFDTLKAPFRGPDGEVTGLVSSSRRPLTDP